MANQKYAMATNNLELKPVCFCKHWLQVSWGIQSFIFVFSLFFGIIFYIINNRQNYRNGKIKILKSHDHVQENEVKNGQSARRTSRHMGPIIITSSTTPNLLSPPLSLSLSPPKTPKSSLSLLELFVAHFLFDCQILN